MPPDADPASGRAIAPEATRVLRGGTVVTMDPRAPEASAVALFDDRIVAVGSDDAVAAWTGRATQVIELEGRTVVPGFIDSHTHVAGNAFDPRNVECRDFYDPAVDSVDEILRRMHAARDGVAPGDWVVGIGGPLQHLRLREERLPTRAELDAAVQDRPAFIAFGPHLTLANAPALEAAGIDSAGPDAPDGTIERGPGGDPTGILREAAQRLVKLRRPGASLDLEGRIEAELKRCASRGVTAIHDVLIHPDELRAYQRLLASGRLPVRVHAMIRSFQSAFEPLGAHGLGLLTGFGSSMLKIGSIKLSVDGGFDQGLFSDTDGDDRHLHPVLRMTQTELDELVDTYHRDGMRLAVHTSGDVALDMALGSFDRALGRSPRDDHRHRIEHMGNYGMREEHLQAARRLDLTPVPNASELYYMGRTAEHVLPRRHSQRPFALRWLVDGGFPLVLASDGGGLWPVDPPRDIAAAVTRATREGGTLAVDEAVSADVALAAFTANAAWVGFEEDDAGMLRAGMRADLAVLSADPRDLATADQPAIEVHATFLGGRVTHSDIDSLAVEP